MMKLKKLIKTIANCQVKGSKEVLITGLTANSKSVAPGNLFIAKKGRVFDGAQYMTEAAQAGASAIVTEFFDPSLKEVTQVVHPNVSFIEKTLAAHYFGYPSRELLMVGITGTNGKTTTSFIVRHLLNSLIGPCGLIGTIEYLIGKLSFPAARTTPDVISNQKMLREMSQQGCTSAVMEVTSHALDQGRVDEIEFDIAIFSNLTLDHLDYHGSIENYAKAKKKLFEQLGKDKKKAATKWAIVNQDSFWTPQMIEGCSANILSYGIESAADLVASQIRLEKEGTYATLTYQGQDVPGYFPLVGKFNIYNCLAATATLLSQNISLKDIVECLSQIPPIRGRLQPVPNSLGLQIYIDFAHTDDALDNVLATLKQIKKDKERLFVVFGCGGDRDSTKRPKMAKSCEKYADFCIVTSDNPRREDPYQICQEIVTGFLKSDYLVEVDRKLAIEKAISLARSGDIILIAGKGHETYQIFSHQTLPFDDYQVAAHFSQLDLLHH